MNLLDAVERGEDVVITRRGGGVTRFRLVPVVEERRSLIGAMAGEVVFANDYDEADADVLAMFDESLFGSGVTRSWRTCWTRTS